MNSTKHQYDRERSGSHPQPSPRLIDTSCRPEAAVFDSAQLFGASTEIGILHQGSMYRLKITRQGKLILNK